MDEIDKYQQFLSSVQRYSSATVSAYVLDCQQFIDYIQAEYNTSDLSQVTVLHVKSYVYHLALIPLVPKSINRKKVALSGLYSFLMRQHGFSANPFDAISALRTPKPLVKYLSPAQVNQAIDAIDCIDFESSRDALILDSLFSLGLRRAELITLSISDLDLPQALIRITGKGNKQRIIPIPKSLNIRLEHYISYRALLLPSTQQLLLTNQGQPIYPMFVQRVVQKHLSASTLHAQVSPHTLRHSLATSLLNNGADINAIKEILGHSSLAATQVYTHTSIEDLKQVYAKAHPKS